MASKARMDLLAIPTSPKSGFKSLSSSSSSQGRQWSFTSSSGSSRGHYRLTPSALGIDGGHKSISQSESSHFRQITPYDHVRSLYEDEDDAVVAAAKSMASGSFSFFGVVATPEEALAFWKHFQKKSHMHTVLGGTAGDKRILPSDAKLMLCNYRGCSLDKIDSGDIGINMLRGKTVKQLERFISNLWAQPDGIEKLRKLCLGEDRSSRVVTDETTTSTPFESLAEEEEVCLNDEYFDQFVGFHSPRVSSMSESSRAHDKKSLSRIFYGDLIKDDQDSTDNESPTTLPRRYTTEAEPDRLDLDESISSRTKSSQGGDVGHQRGKHDTIASIAGKLQQLS